MPDSDSERHVTLNGVRLLVRDVGRGHPLVLVHGSWDDRHGWALVEHELANRFRVVTYDRRGHTDSDDGTGSGTRRDDEDDLADLIETLGLVPASIVAVSFGASIALGLATRRPHLFGNLCVHEPPLLTLVSDDPTVAEIGTAVGTILTLIDGGDETAAARAFVENIAFGPGAWDAMASDERASMAAHARTFAGEQRDTGWADIDVEALGAIGFPVLITCGDQSPPFFTDIVTRLKHAIPGAEVQTIAGAGHTPDATHPAEYGRIIGRFAGPNT